MCAVSHHVAQFQSTVPACCFFLLSFCLFCQYQITRIYFHVKFCNEYVTTTTTYECEQFLDAIFVCHSKRKIQFTATLRTNVNTQYVLQLGMSRRPYVALIEFCISKKK